MNVILHRNLKMTGKRDYVWHEAKLKPQADICSPYYIRMIVNNAPGVLAAVSKVLAENNISIRSSSRRMKRLKSLKSSSSSTNRQPAWSRLRSRKSKTCRAFARLRMPFV